MTVTATVEAVRDVGPDTVAITLATPAGFEARPGQFVQLSATVEGDPEARFYTISSPDTAESFEVTVGLDPDVADFSQWLADRSPGDTLDIEGPYGDQFYDGEKRVVVLAGGPGIGPAVGIGERALADGAEVVIVYEDDTPAHEERLAALAAGGATVRVLTDLDGAVGSLVTDSDDEQTFIYGFADFVERARDAIDAAGGDSGAAKAENFG
jgi:cytochrome-b5 reductase